jgi:hypothetical protein
VIVFLQVSVKFKTVENQQERLFENLFVVLQLSENYNLSRINQFGTSLRHYQGIFLLLSTQITFVIRLFTTPPTWSTFIYNAHVKNLRYSISMYIHKDFY